MSQNERGRDYALEMEGLGKAYRMYPSPIKRVGEALTLGRYKGHHEFWALQSVDAKLLPGASLGLCGANGAGKSTLLKVLAGTTAPSIGRYRIRGRVSSLLELGAGFHMEFNGRANIVMNGVMMGLSKREITSKIDEIIEFAELGDYIDEPVRTYSSGMGLRLGFAIAISVDPDVMIIDEVFAVGDMYFQKKCVDKVYDLKKRNKTILFCSHSLYDVRQMCDEAIWLNKGQVMAQGDSVFVTNEYSAFQRHHIEDFERMLEENFPTKELSEVEKGIALPSIKDARIYKLGTDEECYQCTTGDSLEFRIWWENPSPERTPIHIGVGFMRQDLTTCGGMVTHLDGLTVEGTSGCAVLRVPDIHLLSGQFLTPIILFDEEGVHKYQEFMMPDNLTIRTNTRDVGLFRLEHTWDFTQEKPPAARPAPDAAAADETPGETVEEAGAQAG